MLYYNITTSNEVNKIGYYPQTILSKSYGELLPTYRNVRFNKIANFDPLLIIDMNAEAFVTDILSRKSIMSFGLIVSERLKELINKYKLPEHKFYPVTVNYKNEKLQYYWFHFYDNMFNYIDLKESEFEIFSITTLGILESYSVTSEEFIRNKQNSLSQGKALRLKKIVFNDSFPQYDIFENNIAGANTLISESLLKALTDNGITGFETNLFKIIASNK